MLVLSGRRQAELEATAKECRDGTVCEICVGDVSNEADVEKMFGTVKEKYGRIDVLFNVSAVGCSVIADAQRAIGEVSDPLAECRYRLAQLDSPRRGRHLQVPTGT